MSATQKHQCQEAPSKYLFEYLSPKSKKVKVEKLRKAISSLRGHGCTIAKKIERVPLSDIQNEEISELAHSINKSEGETGAAENFFRR